MAKYAGKNENILDKLIEWQAIEAANIEEAEKEIPKTKNLLIKTMLKALRLEAEKRSLIQQMIVDSMEKEAVNLSPDELQNLSAHLNRHMEAEETALAMADEALKQNELAIPRYLMAYLISGLKKENTLLRRFDDELKSASIPTSATAKTFGPFKAA